ncbi:class A sortase [Macrococcoides bohemicum]|uniref:class A sortase n=1 Tax=Macrococcoides bohemicum TaxID=1903056 RepID=UPI00165D722F|nr:class A sortase [Macrococcus bohemicus]MBC9875558.1 class A sortase [Macrococcus bohemicus]
MTSLEKQREMYSYKKAKQRLVKIMFICIMFLGLTICIAPYTIEHYIMPHAIDKANASVNQLDANKIEENQKRIQETLKNLGEANYGEATSYDKNLSYDADTIRSVDRVPIDVKINQDYVIGKLYVPNVELNIAVLEGLTNQNLDVASGTMKPNQKMGEGNFAIAGHHMIDYNSLFTPVSRMKEYDEIFLSDKRYVYEYVTTKVSVVSENNGNVVDDVPGENLITLVTCSDPEGTARVVVRGKLMKKYKVTEASEDVQNAILN